LKTIGLLLAALMPSFAAEDLQTVYETSHGTETATYEEGIAYYRKLVAAFPKTLTIREMGPTDSGKPLHLVIFSASGEFDISTLKQQGKPVFMINNAIHPGEPDGVDACMMFLRDLASGKLKKNNLHRIVLGVIPFYNIGGVLNRNSTTRVNQSGPKSYGFRGNARNFDLNRDYIKNDSRNARSFAKIFHLLDPEVYLETHVTNGSDHQYVLTVLATQADKLGGEQGRYLNEVFEPDIMKRLDERDVPATPYVNVFGSTPDKGFLQFLDGPRYSTGYTTLFQTLGFMTETHSLKPFKDRVLATVAFIDSVTDAAIERGEEIRELRARTRAALRKQTRFPLKWELDRNKSRKLAFRGYEPTMLPSELTGGERLKYDREKPFEKEVPFYNRYRGELEVQRPYAYVIPQGWHPVVSQLQLNGIAMSRLSEAKAFEVEVYHIEKYDTSSNPYEGHYPHSNTEVTKSKETIRFRKGDWVVPTDQDGVRYLMETLEPQAPDSFFTWNYFDTILQQKEYFSSYIFEDIAAKFLAENPEIEKAFEARKKQDSEFAGNRRAQLHWIYIRTPHYEEAHKRYPVYRMLKPQK